MAQTHFRVDTSIHEKMKQIVKEKGNTTLQDEYKIAIENYIAEFYQEKTIKDSKLENLLDERFLRLDKHLSSMLGRTGMDTSMVLMGLIYFLENHFKESRETIFDVLKKDAVKYFTNKS